jgi:exopolysaccharide biosynthesis polyprenyl glycosylphosphotransferase
MSDGYIASLPPSMGWSQFQSVDRSRRQLASRSRLLQFLQLGLDLLALTAAWFITFELRLLLNRFLSVHMTRAELHLAAPSLLGILLLWILTSLWLSVFGSRSPAAVPVPESLQLVNSTILFTTIAVAVAFFSQGTGASISRSFVVVFAVVAYLVLLVARGLEQFVWMLVAPKLQPFERIAILGNASQAQSIASQLERRKPAHAKLIGVILASNGSDGEGSCPVPVLGGIEQLGEVINRERLDRIVVLNGTLDDLAIESCSKIAQRMGTVLTLAFALSVSATAMRVNTDFGIPTLDMTPVRFTRAQEFIKTALDLTLSGVLLAVFSPLLLVVSILIKLTSTGPVFYRSRRVGRGGRYFVFLKFRTMHVGETAPARSKLKNEKTGHLFKVKQDPRVTPLGRLLRRYSIDELPQLLNVIKGEMSLLGPRPLPAEDLDPDGMSKEFDFWAQQRALVPPGITGLWQIRGRSELSFEEMIALDVEYIRSWSLWLDLKILLATPFAVISGKGAY